MKKQHYCSTAEQCLSNKNIYESTKLLRDLVMTCLDY